MDEILCPNCGKSNPSEAEFCENCQSPLHVETASGTPPDESSPGWLQHIRERSQAEKTDNPPLGDFGEAENRPFDQPITPSEIPDWLKELQKTELPIKDQPPADEVDWIARLHEIQAGSNLSHSQSTAFYSDEELAAMAAAANNMEQADESILAQFSIKQDDAEDQTDQEAQPAASQPPVEEPATDEKILSQPEEIIPEEPVQPDQFASEEPVISSEESAPWLKMLPPVDFPSEQDTPQSTDEPEYAFLADRPSGNVASNPESDDVEIPLPVVEKSKPSLSSFFGSEKKKPDSIFDEPQGPDEALIPEGVFQPQYSRSAEYSGRLEISESQRDSITVLKSMLIGEIQPQNPVPTRGKFSGRAMRAVIGVILLIAMGYPFFTGFVLVKPQALFSPGVVTMHNTIDSLPENASFLLVTDFEPAFSGEMKAASTGVIDHLMMKGMNFTVISTVPSGPALGRDLLSTVRPGTFAYPPEKIAVLGFIPGGTSGLLDFMRNPRLAAPMMDNAAYAWTYPAAQAVNTIHDYAGVLVITENAETGRAWIEQFRGVLMNQPIMMVVSAQSAPIIRPYLDSGQLSGLVSGRVEGAMYDRLMDAPPRASIEMSSYQIGVVLAAALIILGGLYGMLKKVFYRQPVGSSEEWHAD